MGKGRWASSQSTARAHAHLTRHCSGRAGPRRSALCVSHCDRAIHVLEFDMPETEATAWVPFRIFPLDLHVPNNLYECLVDFSTGLTFALTRLYPFVAETEARVTRPSRAIARQLFLLNPESRWGLDSYEFVQVRCSLIYDKESIQSMNVNRPMADDEIARLAASELSSVLEEALVLAQLAYPALIASRTGLVWLGRYLVATISEVFGFMQDAVYPDIPAWPAVGVLPITEVCDWVSRLGLLRRGIARTPVERALASFTHAAVLPGIHNDELLFRVMQGLEAFYCRGNGDLRSQLSEKSKLFLGPWKDTKNIVGRLYDIRSKVVHGDFDQRWRNFDLELGSRDEKNDEVFTSALGLAVRMLLATLQRCAREKIVGVEFNYSLSIATANNSMEPTR